MSLCKLDNEKSQNNNGIKNSYAEYEKFKESIT
jgi:hypothetical protein